MKLMNLVCGVAAAALTWGSALAAPAEHGTKDEAVALVNAAYDHAKKVGPEQAFKDFTAGGTWLKKDLFVFAYDTEGVSMASGGVPKLVGKNMSEFKDGTGKFFQQEMSAVTSKAPFEGWVDYSFMHVETKKLQLKRAWVRRIQGTPYAVGVGYFPE